ncbi:MAG: FMN-binding negative transcriptional regulator [Caulobacterales bacterium]|jgi:transcriptional regulator
MHPAPYHREEDMTQLEARLAAYSFATLCVVGEGRPMVVQVPVLLRRLPEGLALDFHVAQRNAIAPHLSDETRAVVLAAGPNAYVSPDWMSGPDQVPTWNYVSVEAEGPLSLLTREGTVALLDDLSAQEEARLAPKPPWTRDKMSPAFFERLLGAIVGARLHVERLEGTVKLSQNKPETDRAAIASALGEHPMAALMRAAIPPRA